MNWYTQYKTAGKSTKDKSDIDVNYSEIDKDYVQPILDDISKILKNPKLEKIKEDVKDKTVRSEKEVMKRPIGKVQDLKVFLVNGNEVKIKFFMDFVEGGNGMVYGKKEDKGHPKFVPEDELWVDAEVDMSSFPYILVHEAVEYFLMKNENKNYDQAHRRANGVEKTLRQKKYFK